MNIMVHTAKGADNHSYKETSTLHGTGNYVKGLKYLYYVAQYVRSGKTNQQASEEAYSKIPHDNNDSSYAVLVTLKKQTELMLIIVLQNIGILKHI